MSTRSVRRALGVGAGLLVVAALATSAFAGAFGSGGSRRSALRAPAILPAAYRRDASVGGGGNDELLGGPGADSRDVGPSGGSTSSC